MQTHHHYVRCPEGCFPGKRTSDEGPYKRWQRPSKAEIMRLTTCTSRVTQGSDTGDLWHWYLYLYPTYYDDTRPVLNIH
jgi:hypothetical protein